MHSLILCTVLQEHTEGGVGLAAIPTRMQCATGSSTLKGTIYGVTCKEQKEWVLHALASIYGRCKR